MLLTMLLTISLVPFLSERKANRAGGAPRGLLCFVVTEMLSNQSMSGVEIVEAIEKGTGGRWKPSSGSIYPLLALLNEKGFTTEVPSKETGIKRYALTEKGKEYYEKQIAFGQKMLDKLEFLMPLLIRKFQFDPNDEKILSGAGESAQRIVKTLLDLRAEKDIQISDKLSKDIEKTLKKCADELEEIVKSVCEESSLKISSSTKRRKKA